MDLILVDKNNIKALADFASEIWHEYWPIILSEEQIDYMVKIFQSEEAIRAQIENEDYRYYFIGENGVNAGYTKKIKKKDYLFLSKLYIAKEYRHRGLGGKVFNKIKTFGYDKIRLTVNKYNKNTINAYLKYGFKIVESVETDIGHGFVMDDYIMEYNKKAG